MSKFFAHSAPDTVTDSQQGHRLAVHLHDTGQLAKSHLNGLGGGAFGQAAGLLHDLGKYSIDFQRRLAGSSKRVDHATAGARVAMEEYGPQLGKMLAFCIAGHHAGLANGDGTQPQGSTLEQRLSNEYRIPEIDPTWEQEIQLPDFNAFDPLQIDTVKGADGFTKSFFIRMLFSALVDADRTDTNEWFSGAKARPPITLSKTAYPDLAELQARLDRHLVQLCSKASPSDMNTLRRQVLHAVRKQAGARQGVFTLTVPTGGGKTLTSLAFALDHALQHGLRRIIYVIPYTSIVEQTARVFRTALDDQASEFIIEHHSNFDEESVTGREGSEALRLAMDTWNAPVVVTTAVQFFESLFSNRPSRCRKLHHLIDSVVILDEAQTLPLRFLRPCVAAIDELARNYGASVVLCTATQPALGAATLKPTYGFAGGFKEMRELAPDPKALYESAAANRTRIVAHDEVVSDAVLIEHLLSADQALCIVNTRRHARTLHESLATDATGSFHLTTAMCATHRRAKLKQIRERLKAGRPVRLVATSLVEAGVDLDFPVVWRAEAGLESIIQAAGRCNREGKRATGNVHVFSPANKRGRPLRELAQFAAAARSVMRRHSDPLSLAAIEDYFRETYWLAEDWLDEEQILARLQEQQSSLDFPFHDIDRKFRLIENTMSPVIVPRKTASQPWLTPTKLLRDLEYFDRPGAVARKLQPHTVQIPPCDRNRLIATGAAQVIREKDFGQQFVVVINEDLYDADVGLNWDDPFYRKSESLVH